MKILVTGSSGFLGSHTADALTQAGHDVVLFDQFPSQYKQLGQTEILGSILDKELLSVIMEDIDVVYHLAGIADIDECISKPFETAQVNILGTVNLLEACRKGNVKRFIFASSSYVYSDSGYFYRVSKQACEQYIETYQKIYGLQYTCLRYGSLYGDRADSRNSIFRLLHQALTENRITYHGSGDEMREFIHVRDAARISVRILDNEYENECLVISGAEKYRYKDLLTMISEIMNHKVSVEYYPSDREAHYKITPYNFSPKLGRKIVSSSHIDMGQGILSCLAYILEELNTKNSEENLSLYEYPVANRFSIQNEIEV